MTTETQVETTAETQITAAEPTNQPEVVTPEVTADTGQKPASTETPAKTAEQLAQEIEQLRREIAERDRKITKRDRTQGKLHLELQQLRQQVSAAQPKAPAESEEEDVAIKPADLKQVVQREALTLAQQIAEHKELVDRCNNVAAQGKKQFADFNASLTALIEEAGPLIDPQSGFKTALGEQILEADNPAALIQYLGKHPEIAAELDGLTPGRMARKLAAIESQMTAKPKTSNAPKPLEPVKATASSSGLSDDLSADEWRRRRDAEVRKRNGR
jgi:chromosome segregation ATPase